MALSLIVKNIDNTARSYDTISVSASGEANVVGQVNQFNVASDSGIRSDIAQQRLLINNGFIDLPTLEAIGFLDFIVNFTKTITGGTDSTIIGNVGDRLKVDIGSSISVGSGPPSYSKKLRYVDMNVANGGVARGTSITEAAGWVNVLSYSGSGLVTGFTIQMGTANTNWYIRMLIDNEEIFLDANGILVDDINGVYGMSIGTQNTVTQGLGLGVNANQFYFTSPLLYPIVFASSVVLKIRRKTGGGTKTFNGGVIAITKET